MERPKKVLKLEREREVAEGTSAKPQGKSRQRRLLRNHSTPSDDEAGAAVIGRVKKPEAINAVGATFKNMQDMEDNSSKPVVDQSNWVEVPVVEVESQSQDDQSRKFGTPDFP